MYGAESSTQRFNLSRKLFMAHMLEGALVHNHGLEMIDMIKQLSQLGFVMDHDRYIDLILSPLPRSFSQFVEHFHMNKIKVTLKELVFMLRTAEANFDYEKSKFPTSEGKLGASGSIAKNRMKQLAAEGAYFHCVKTGHWKKDCRVTSLNNSSTWVLDTGYGKNLCNLLQVLIKVRRLRAGDFDLRLGDESRIIVEAVGIFDIIFVMVLY
ncbi:UBN2_2 domain-containing protein [Cephalotus follicularis]|uniref:UBN2_2 domain-containing protein n=1 Tax=Cephalotus follicularis TaxID=3775 RepID=A0A1Q3BHU3_CEPFO|nr:UBN2_2 domain-containing protein [Cephalotus follicularis]